MSKQLMDGKSIAYTYEGGWRYRVRFYDGMAAYESLTAEGNASYGASDIPYQSRQIREGLIQIVWQERELGDMVSLLIDEPEHIVWSTALLGYASDKPNLHFQRGRIDSLTDERAESPPPESPDSRR